MTVDSRKAAGQKLGTLPTWLPAWSVALAELYFSGTTSMFVLHGNTFDFIQTDGDGEVAYGTLSEFLAEQLFGRWDLVLHYDLAQGLRCLAGRNPERQMKMVPLANRRVAPLAGLSKDPAAVFETLDRFVAKNVVGDDQDRLSAAILLDHASYLAPAADRAGQQSSRNLVTLLNWASSPYVKQLNLAVVLMDSRLADFSDRLTGNPHVACIEVPLPTEPERAKFLQARSANRPAEGYSDLGLPELAQLTAGISLTDLNVLIRSAQEGGRRLDQKRFQELKKRLIERQAQGFLEFVQPRWGLDTVVGHEAAKKRLRDDAELLRRGALDSLPMGYLLCGPVGTGKSFLASCAAGSIGIPCVTLKNFRSKYVGETEGNLERVLSVLRGMGPVVVIVDEADAMLGDRQQQGDSGVGGRVFGMIASQMGDTQYRGRMIWMLLTARPDLLPIDLKRQGRAEIHIPLFYPTDPDEIRQMFVILARKIGARLAPDDVPEIPHAGNLSGADIEGIVGRAWRETLLAGQSQIGRETLKRIVDGFLPSTQSLERQLQEVAAMIECTDREFLPEAVQQRMDQMGGREKLQQRLNQLKQLVES